MTPGQAVRKLLGPQFSRVVGRHYRAAFVDLALVASALAAEIPRDARVLDVGGGDGEPLNHLLALRPDIELVTIDVADEVGRWIDMRHAHRVRCLPRTSVQDYAAMGQRPPDVVITSDVLHHVPAAVRRGFIAGLTSLFDRSAPAMLLVKDVEPGHLRATLGYWSDRYVTGDRSVQLISRAELSALVQTVDSTFACRETGLFAADAPNYALVFTRPPAASGAAFNDRRPTP